MTEWKTYLRLPIIAYLTVTLLVVGLLLYRGYLDLENSRYAQTVSLALGEGISAEINYPPQIPTTTDSQKVWPITIQLIDHRSVDGRFPLSYEFVFDAEDFIFANEDGKIIEPKINLTTTAESYTPKATLYIKPLPSQELPEDIDIQVTISNDYQSALNAHLSVRLQSRPAAWARFLVTYLFEISVIAILVSWIVNAFDQVSKEKKEYIEKQRERVRSIEPSETLQAMQKWVELDRENAKRDDRLLQEELNKKQRLLTTEDSQRKFLRLAGGILFKNANHNALQSLRDGSQIFRVLSFEFDKMGNGVPKESEDLGEWLAFVERGWGGARKKSKHLGNTQKNRGHLGFL